MVLINYAYWHVCRHTHTHTHTPQMLITSKVWVFNLYVDILLWNCIDAVIMISNIFFVTGITFSHNSGYHYDLNKHIPVNGCTTLRQGTASSSKCSVNSYVWCVIFCILDMWLLQPRSIEMIILSRSWEFYGLERGIECECDPILLGTVFLSLLLFWCIFSIHCAGAHYPLGKGKWVVILMVLLCDAYIFMNLFHFSKENAESEWAKQKWTICMKLKKL